MVTEPSCTHHSRRAAALDVLHNAVEDANATADCEQQHGEERTNCPDTRRLPATNEPCLGPPLLGILSAVAVAERYRDIVRGQLWLVRSTGPGFHCNHEQAGKQQHDTGGV